MKIERMLAEGSSILGGIVYKPQRPYLTERAISPEDEKQESDENQRERKQEAGAKRDEKEFSSYSPDMHRTVPVKVHKTSDIDIIA